MNFDMTITFFEDLKQNKKNFYQVWASLLGLGPETFEELFEQKHINKKEKTKQGAKKVFSLKFVETKIKNILINVPFVFELSKKIYNFLNLQYLFNTRVALKSVHKRPDGKNLKNLHELLKVDKYCLSLFNLEKK